MPGCLSVTTVSNLGFKHLIGSADLPPGEAMWIGGGRSEAFKVL
jgi:hypothetical protein